MAKVNVEDSLCTGCGLCSSICPEVFEVGDDNIARAISNSCNAHNLQDIVEQCPVSAIIVR